MSLILKDDFDSVVFNAEQMALRDQLIDEGIESIKANEKRPARIDGGIQGFDFCRPLNSIADFEAVIGARHAQEKDRIKADVDPDDYWRFRCATAQIEFVYERMKVACGSFGINGEQSARAYLHVADIRARPREP